MGKTGEVLSALFMIVLFGALTGIVISAFLDDYDIVEMQSAEGTVVKKVSEKSLFTPPTYHVLIEFEGRSDVEEEWNRVMKWRFNKLESGDTIKGFTILHRNFSTVEDFIYNSFLYLVLILAMSMFVIIGIVVLLMSIPAVEKALNKPSKGKGKGMKVLYSIIGVFIFFTARFLYNIVSKLWPFLKTTTDAKIIDADQYTTYRKYEDSEYTFTVLFQDQEGNDVEVMKEVTHHTFSNFHQGGTIPITYNNLNPYNIFIKGTTITDAIYASFYLEVLLYLFMMFIIGFACYAIPKWKRRQSSKNNSNHK